MAVSLTVVGLILAALAWLIFGGGDDPDTKVDLDIDRDELSRAEAEVRDAPDPDHVRDWGPGAPKPQPPESR
ncbi:MAG TPA: hypothetical protein VMC86_05540 [Gemmatimonadales bacterium]|nr:hypothetical protein [Gemmatimonadales bacterium]